MISKEDAWKKYEEDKEIEFQHYVYDGYRYNPSLEEAFNPYNRKLKSNKI